ncbi:MAG: hypothetical protein Q9213_008064 [Squamulea squamosa]
MQPGRVYVGRLPNHNGPVFVRKRRKSFVNPFGVPSVISNYAPQQYPPDYQCTMYQPPPPPYIVPAPQAPVVQVPQPVDSTTTTVTTTVEPQSQHSSAKYSCASCGKFRSPRYHYRHPLASGETPRPTLCRKCVKQHTSSEDYDDTERAYWERKEQKSRRKGRQRSYSSDEWTSSSSQEERRRHHKYKSSEDGRWHRRSKQSSSGVSTKIYIVRRPEERRRQPTSSLENVSIIRRVRTIDERPRSILRIRHRYGPYDGHYSHEEHYEDVQVEDDDYFEPRGRSRSRTFKQQSHDGSHSYEDEYVRVSTSASQSRPLSLFDRLTGSRSRSRSRKSNSYEDERIRITIRSREPSPLRYERYEEEYEERLEGSSSSPWRRRSESMLVHHSSETESRRGGYFGRPQSTYSERVHESRRLGGRSVGYRSPGRTMRSLRGRSPEPILRRRRSSDHEFGRRPRVRFARSTSSHREEHVEPHDRHGRDRHASEMSFSDEEEFPSAGK